MYLSAGTNIAKWTFAYFLIMSQTYFTLEKRFQIWHYLLSIYTFIRIYIISHHLNIFIVACRLRNVLPKPFERFMASGWRSRMRWIKHLCLSPHWENISLEILPLPIWRFFVTKHSLNEAMLVLLDSLILGFCHFFMPILSVLEHSVQCTP